mmetsp:Transcript_2853/g.3128  ORF Transcript_2853/g.3128 Transcript_2853/m.3128 type:complete len:84 (-) Transcript_2853:181-432(-)
MACKASLHSRSVEDDGVVVVVGMLLFISLSSLFVSFLDQLQIYVYCKNKNYHQVQGQIHIKKGNPMILWVSSLQGNGKMKGEE